MGMILRIASSRIVGQGDIVGRSGYFSLNLSANSVMRGRLDARRTLKSLVADLRLLKRLQMKKEELFAFAELLSENNPEEKTSSLLSIIGEQSKENLFTALAAYQKKEKSKLDTIRRIYPNLSPSELNICRLILQDKTVSQICELLHRSSGNITSQRANIRAKLGLKKNDNLKEALQERMRLYEEEHRQEDFSAMR